VGGWLRQFPSGNGDAARMVCFPHAGGIAGYFRPLAEALHGLTEVAAVQYPGRHDRHREPFARSVAELVDGLLPEVMAHADSGSCCLFGHSMGSVVAFETARRMRAEGAPPAVLFVSGGRAPHLFARSPAAREPERTDAALLDELRSLGGTPPEVLREPHLLRFVLPAVRADFAILAEYRHLPSEPLGCPIVALVGRCDARVGIGEAGQWVAHTADRFDLRVLPGGHFYLDDPGNVREVAALVERYLAPHPMGRRWSAR
jgi:pyochelin biosynthesis protein PchC